MLEKKTELPEDKAREMTSQALRELGDQIETAKKEKKRAQDLLHYLIEVYIDDFIAASRAKLPEELKHISRALLRAIHDVFPEGKH